MAAAVATLVVSTGVVSVLAVHDLDFELDGDVLNNVGGAETKDWSDLFDANGDEKALPAGFTATGFKKDFLNNGATFITSDTTTFATGSKDTLPIAGWQCNFDNNVNSKIDVMNAYAAAYTDSDTGDQLIYFGLERNTNTGDANVGFWFLQDAVGCETAGGAEDFTGAHHDGDLLIVSAFSNGGTVSTINVYRWDGGEGGGLNPVPVAQGVDCRSNTTPPGDSACAVANTGDITTPWLTANFKDKVGNKLRTAEFFEGGLNLTDEGLDGKCFNTFIGDTRSSTSLTATLFDYAAGTIGQCTSTTVTTPSITSGTIPADPNDASISVTDQADITVTGVASFAATVTWHLCGPMAANSTDLCGTGGVAVGAAKAVTSSPATVVSDAAIVTSAGRYCWRADFSGDESVGVPPSSDSRSSECFVIDPRQPTLVTQATTGPVAFGNPISDTVTLTNTAHKPGSGGPAGSNGTINPTTLGGDATGDITLTAYGPDSCSTVAYGPVTIAASGDGSYGGVASAFEFTPSSPGEYVFVASYAGDLPNTLGVSAIACANQPSNEKVTVQQIPTEISTAQRAYPNDSATITSSVVGDILPATGTVIFRLYDNATCADADDSVGGGLLYKETKTSVGGANSVTVMTNNTTVAVSSNSTVYWKVTYATGDSAHTGRQSNCTENTSFVFVNDAGPGTLFP
jgi:hypothetical protein